MSRPLQQEQQWKVDMVKGSKQGKCHSINMVDVLCLSLRKGWSGLTGGSGFKTITVSSGSETCALIDHKAFMCF